MRSRAPYLLVGWLWFLGTLVPVIGVIQVGAQAMADRYAYIPLIGIFVAVVWGIADLCESRRIGKSWQAAAAVIVLLALSWTTWKQISYWNDSYALWSHALAVTADNPVSETQLGMALLATDQNAAMKHFERAIELGTHDPTSYLNLGACLNGLGQHREAIPLLEAALRMDKDVENLVDTHLDLGFAYTSMGEYENARLQYRAAVQLDRSKVVDTIQQLAEFAVSHPSAREFMKLGLLLEEAGQNEAAAQAFERILQLDPNMAAARAELSRIWPTGR
jgi:tetratricopeptide (TPR) repeat protein